MQVFDKENYKYKLRITILQKASARNLSIVNRLLFSGGAAFSIIYFQFSLSILNFHFQFPIYNVPPQPVCFPLAFPNLLPSCYL